MKLTLAFLLLIGATFQNTQSAEIIETDINTPSISIPSFHYSINLKNLANSALNKANDGLTWINDRLTGLRSSLNTAGTEIKDGATYTETKITKTETITIDDD